MIYDRYITTPRTKTLPDGTVVYMSTMPRTLPTNPLTDPQIVARDVVRMDVLAYNMYGSAQEWWRIASANRKADGSLYFKPGATIIIPSK